MSDKPGNLSSQNHALLITVSEEVKGLGKALADFMTRQGEVNDRLHRRIDTVAERSAAAVEAIKDGLAQRGRLSGGLIISIIAAVLSCGAILGGAITSYVGVRLDGLRPQIERLGADVLHLQHQVHAIEVDSSAADAASRIEREWIKRELDRAGH